MCAAPASNDEVGLGSTISVEPDAGSGALAAAPATATSVDGVVSGAALSVGIGAGSGTLIAEVGKLAATVTVGAGSAAGPDARLRSPTASKPIAPNPTTVARSLERLAVDPTALFDATRVVPSLTVGVDAPNGSATGSGSSSSGAGPSGNASDPGDSGGKKGNDASLGAHAPSTTVSSRTSVEAPSNRSRADFAVA